MRGRDRVALALVALALGFATLAVGGVHRWAACVAALLGLVSALPYLTSRRTASLPSPMLWPLGVAIALTALQLVPLPAVIAEKLVPAKLELITANARAWGESDPSWVVASFDPPATLVELAKLIGYLALGYTCVRLASIRSARRWLAMIVTAVATLIAVVTLVHHAIGASKLYGIYQPSTKPALLSPFINPNNLASLMALGAPLALALAVSSAGTRRLAWISSCAVLSGTALLSSSRGGLVGLIAGMVVVIAILVIQRRAGTDDEARRVSPAVAFPAAIVAVCTVVLIGLLTAGDLARELEHTSLDEVHQEHTKFQLWSLSTTLAERNHWLGIGHGAFEPAFTPYATTGDVSYSYVENGCLQAVLDWGVPGAALLAVVLLSAGRVGLRRWRHGPLEAGAVAAIASVAVHDFADFSLELPGIAMTLIAASAILFPSRLGTATDPAGSRAKQVPRDALTLRSISLALGVLVVTVAASPLGRPVRSEVADVVATTDDEARIERARAALQRHPADYVLSGRAAEALFALRDPRAIKIIARALAMNPNNAGLHLLAAHMLVASQRPEQSAVEFALAARWARNVDPIVADVVKWFSKPEDVARALPTEPRQAWRIVNSLADHHDAALAYALRVTADYPSDTEMQSMLAFTAVGAGRPDLAVPAGRRAFEREATARRAIVLAQALVLDGKKGEAITLLGGAMETTRASPRLDRVVLCVDLSTLQIEAGDLQSAKSVLERAAEIAADSRELRIAVHAKAADVEDRLGNHNQAEWEREQARALDDH